MRFIFLTLLLVLPALARADDSVPLSSRGLKICVVSDAPQVVRDAATQVLAAVPTQPLLVVMAGSTPPSAITDSAELLGGRVSDRAYNHIVVVGLPNDPLIQTVWQREALVNDKGIYVFGFGNLQGDIGYIESDRNPFVHGSAIKIAPYETEIVTLTGTTPEGVRQAVQAFLAKGLINGVVAAPGWTRGAPTLLDRDPLAPDFALPAVPTHVGNSICVGVTEPNESVYRGVLETAGVKPQQIWQFKYYAPGVWDGPGQLSAMPEFLAGLHRTASDNALLVARFSSAGEAATAAQQIGTTSKWQQDGAEWTGSPMQLYVGSNLGPLPRTVRLWSKNDCVYISTLSALDAANIP